MAAKKPKKPKLYTYYTGASMLIGQRLWLEPELVYPIGLATERAEYMVTDVERGEVLLQPVPPPQEEPASLGLPRADDGLPGDPL